VSLYIERLTKDGVTVLVVNFAKRIAVTEERKFCNVFSVIQNFLYCVFYLKTNTLAFILLSVTAFF